MTNIDNGLLVIQGHKIDDNIDRSRKVEVIETNQQYNANEASSTEPIFFFSFTCTILLNSQTLRDNWALENIC